MEVADNALKRYLEHLGTSIGDRQTTRACSAILILAYLLGLAAKSRVSPPDLIIRREKMGRSPSTLAPQSYQAFSNTAKDTADVSSLGAI